MSEQTLRLNYIPRDYQQNFHANFKRWNLLIWHRRAGKSKASLAQLLHMGLKNNFPNPKYAFVSPTYRMSKSIAWDEIKSLTREIPFVTTNEAELKLTIERPWLKDKITFYLLSAENYDSILGIFLDGVLIDEYAIVNPIVFTRIIRPLLSDRQGFCIFTSTPRGQANHLYELYTKVKDLDDWFVDVRSVDKTNVIPKEELDNLIIGMSQEEINQEFYCSWTTPNSGSYYGQIIQELKNKTPSQVTSVPHDPAAEVKVSFDLGIGDSTSLWFFQEIGNAIHIIDFFEDAGKGLDYYVAKMREGHRSKYLYGEIILPHDVNQRELSTGKSRLDILRGLGLNRLVVLPISSVEDGIYNVRATLPRCWFDEEKTFQGLQHLEAYTKSYDNTKKVFSNRPKHDASSHAADSFRYLCLGTKSPTRMSGNLMLPQVASHDYDIFDLSEDR